MELPSFYKTFFREKPLHTRLWSKIVIGLALAYGLLTVYSPALAEPWSMVELRQDIARFLTSEYNTKGQVQVTVGKLDARLSAYQCPQTPVMQTRDATGNGGNISVQVKCKATPGWAVHIPAQVSIFRELPVAARDIVRGERVTAADILWESINISGLRQSYHTNAEDVIGQEVKRNLGQGLPFVTTSLDAPTLVRRGDMVDLQSKAGSIMVSASGTAMTDGRLGQKIRIRNNQSDRIVTGTVIASGKVSTF